MVDAEDVVAELLPSDEPERFRPHTVGSVYGRVHPLLIMQHVNVSILALRQLLDLCHSRASLRCSGMFCDAIPHACYNLVSARVTVNRTLRR